MGFGEGISEVGREYLEKGASRPDWYFKAEKKEDLLEAFKTIVDNIENDSKNTKFEGASSTAPATTSTRYSQYGGNGSFEYRLLEQSVAVLQIKTRWYAYQYDRVVLPSFNNRLTLVNDGSKTYFIDSVADNEASNADFGISDGSAKDKLEWKNALLKWTGRAGSDEAIKADAETKGYSQSYRISSH